MSNATPPSPARINGPALWGRSLDPECRWSAPSVAPARVGGASASVSNPRSEIRPRCLELRWVSGSRLSCDGQPRGCTDIARHATTRRLCDPPDGGHYEGMYVLLQLCRWTQDTVLPTGDSISRKIGSVETLNRCYVSPVVLNTQRKCSILSPPINVRGFTYYKRGDSQTSTRLKSSSSPYPINEKAY